MTKVREADKTRKLSNALKRVGMFEEACEIGAAVNTMLWELINALTRNKELEKEMDKKMAKVTKQMKTAERDVKAKKPAAAVKALKGAEKKNVKLTKIDRDVRDPKIKAFDKMKKKGC